MAEVFLAQRMGEEGFSRTVAIKTILAHGAEEEAVRLFLDEARVAAAVEHAAIVQTFDLGYENETLFIAMEYVAGPTLSRLVRELKKKHDRLLPPAVVAYIGARVAAALDYAHRRATSNDGAPLNLVHRDISPQNILMTRTGLIKLSDFGVARASIQTHRTRTGQVRGKAAYMAPEQVRAKQLDGRTDIFALGLVLFEALTAKRAFHRSGDIQSMRAVLSDPVPPVRHFNEECSPELEAVIARSVEKDPNKRFQNAGEMERALVAIADQVGASHLERQLSEVIDQVFGTAEMYESNDAGPAVEAWQPTIAAEAQDIRPMRIGGRLDPEVARMLQTPATASQSQQTPPSSVSGDALTPAPATGSVPGAHSPISLPSHTFAENPHASATGLNSLTPTHTQTANLFPRKRLLRFGLPLLAALVGVVGMMGWRLLTETTQAPEAPKEPVLEASPAVVARPKTKAPEISRPKPQPRPAPAKARRQPPPPRPSAKAPAQAAAKAPASRIASPSRPKPAAKTPSKPAQPRSMNKRILSAARAHEQKGHTEMAGKLRRILMNISMGAQPSAADRALLKEAERALR